MRGVGLYSWLSLLIIGSVYSCVPRQCLLCNTTDLCGLCLANNTVCIPVLPDNCSAAFEVDLSSSSGFTLQGSDPITLGCVHNLPLLNLMFSWQKDEGFIDGENQSLLKLENKYSVKGKYKCNIQSPCGNFTSVMHDLTSNENNVLVLVVCGVAAVVVVLILALAMKCVLAKEKREGKLRRQNLENRQRGFEIQP